MVSSLFLIFLAAVNLPFGFTVAIEVTAAPGEDAVLPCTVYDYNHERATKLSWRRLEPRISLLEYDNGKITSKNANYANRIYLQSPTLEGKNYKLVLKNVTTKDNGQYQCQVAFETQQSLSAHYHTFRFKVVAPGGSGSPVKLFLPALMFSLLMAMILL